MGLCLTNAKHTKKVMQVWKAQKQCIFKQYNFFFYLCYRKIRNNVAQSMSSSLCCVNIWLPSLDYILQSGSHPRKTDLLGFKFLRRRQHIRAWRPLKLPANPLFFVRYLFIILEIQIIFFFKSAIPACVIYVYYACIFICLIIYRL